MTTHKTKKARFPLFKHRNGQWAKKIRGKLHYFGVHTDREDISAAAANRLKDAAESKYVEERDDLQAGRMPRGKQTDVLTLRDGVNRYLTSKKRLHSAGELSTHTFNDYHTVCDAMLAFFGKDRAVTDLRPEDWERYREKIAATRGPTSILNWVVRTRMIFKWLLDNDHIDRPMRFGSSFSVPKKATIRKAKQAGGKRTFEAKAIRQLVATAKQPLRAMILLGINCGFGQNDCASLPLSAVDLEGGLIVFPRPKTGTERRCPLWKETVQALREAIAARRKPKTDAEETLVFLTHHGARWVRHQKATDGEKEYFNDNVAREFNKLLDKLGLKRRGSFYNLRHSFRTVADGANQGRAIDAIMGHTDSTMAGHYIEAIDDSRLQAVVDHVHAWLWPKQDEKADPAIGENLRIAG
jgi:integrase